MELLTSAVDRAYYWFNTWSYGILLNFVYKKCKRGLELCVEKRSDLKAHSWVIPASLKFGFMN